MREIVIGENEAGQRLDKFLAKYMKKAPKSFFYKMLRKKNIVLNGKKASGNEKLAIGDQVRLFLAEETIRGFSEAEELMEKKLSQKKGTLEKSQIIYEDKDILLINKPAGILSQRQNHYCRNHCCRCHHRRHRHHPAQVPGSEPVWAQGSE